MASNIEYEEMYLALQKEYNQTLKDSIATLTEYTALQAKCERYEQTLIAIGNGCATPQRRANEALSGEGEKVPDEGKIMVCNNSDAFRYWTANIKGYRIAHQGHITEIWLPKGMTSEVFANEWGEYENANNPINQKEDQQ